VTAAIVLALCAAASWGAVDLCAGLAARRSSAVGAAFWLHLTGAVTLLPFIVGRLVAVDAQDAIAGAGAGVVVALGDVVFGLALRRSSIGAVSAVAGVVCVAVPVFVQMVSGERIVPPAVAGLVFAGLAVALASLGTRGDGARTTLAGVAYAVLAGVAFGIPCIFMIHTHSANAIGFLFVQKFVGALTILPVVGMAGAARTSLWRTRTAWQPAVASGVLSALANVLYAIAVHHGPVIATATIALAFGTPCAVVLAAIFVRERLTRAQWAAVIAAFAGVGALCTAP
jgi:drug/metabolite transporter (DMT)-like permease